MIPGWIEATGLPPGVRGGTASRIFQGVSAAPYGPANFGDRCGDDPLAVALNRALLCAQLGLISEPLWLHQVHGTRVLTDLSAHAERLADAGVARNSSRPAVVLTADCLPLVLAAADASEIAAIHAGWRGLAAGVIEATLDAMHCVPEGIAAWLGPAISQSAFEVGPEMRDAMLAADPGCAQCFVRGQKDRWHADLYALAERRLRARGLTAISGGEHCTVRDPALHSYRRDAAQSGRMATLVWSGW